MTLEEFRELERQAAEGMARVQRETKEDTLSKGGIVSKKKSRKKNTAYSRAFKKVKGQYMKKSGGWKKGGFARAVRAAHRMAKK